MISRTDALEGAAEIRPTTGLATGWSWRRAADFVSLTKPRVVLMVAMTALVGYYVGAGSSGGHGRLLPTILGVALAAAGTLGLNQVLEREVDACMSRTCRRPLPDGRLQPVESLVFALVLCALGLGVLAVGAGLGATAVTVATGVLYLLAYTPLKRVTPLATVVGAVPGALPPVAGWVAGRGELDAGAGVLFAILFLWQLPHTLAIARLYAQDYARGGIRVLPVVDPDGGSTERQIVTGTLALQVAALLPTLVGLAGPVYFFGAVILGAGFLACSVAQALGPSPGSTRRVVLASVVYLPLLLGLLALDRVG